MHKKVILLDDDKVLLGSANLTGYGVGNSDEFSVLIRSEPFARRVDGDIRRIRLISKPISQLEF